METNFDIFDSNGNYLNLKKYLTIMRTQIKKAFSLLNPKAPLFEEIRIQQPKWWNLLREDKELYIEIRKDNSINVYFLGGSVARISFKNDFEGKIHHKYLEDNKFNGNANNGTDKTEYRQIDFLELNKNKISEIKQRIKNNYIKHCNDENQSEKVSEKCIQGNMIKENPNYIDSEFQFNKDDEIGKLRIDLIELSNGVLSFVELKGIFDSRLRNDVLRNQSYPEVVKQMAKYSKFIAKYKVDIIDYYKKIIEIKNSLGLTNIENANFTINKTPKLIIANTYKKVPTPKKRVERINEIEKLLNIKKINYEIIICN
jgi:hypothetical protein